MASLPTPSSQSAACSAPLDRHSQHSVKILRGAANNLPSPASGAICQPFLPPTSSITLPCRYTKASTAHSAECRGAGGHAAYVRMSTFGPGSASAVYRALHSLQSQRVEALVLDLRNNPGGLVSAG